MSKNVYTSKTVLKRIHFYIECRVREYNESIKQNKIYDSLYKKAELEILIDFCKKVYNVRTKIIYKDNVISELQMWKYTSGEMLELKSEFEE